MRKALQSANPNRSQVSVSASIPAPFGGLNARDAQAIMPPTDARTLDNWFPQPDGLTLRAGSQNWVTGINAHVEHLAAYNAATASKLFAFAGTSVYDVTSTGAVGAAVVTGLTNARWVHTNMGTPGGQFLMAVNGMDNLLRFDGTNWTKVTAVSASPITGIATTSIAHINTFKSRVWLTEVNSLRAWYLPAASIGGAASSMDFSAYFNLGGYLMGMCTWSLDNAAGVDDYAVFVSSEGEVLIYRGEDPTSSTFTLAAHFRVGRPIGRKFFVKAGADIVLICADGFYPLHEALLTDRSQSQIAISDKIQNLINNDAQKYGSNYGWQPTLYPIGNKLIVNVPLAENQIQYQYVMNTINGAWCRFTGWNANCFELMGDKLFYGSNLTTGVPNSAAVIQCDTGVSDNGANIIGDVDQAQNNFGQVAQIKHFKMVRPIFQAQGAVNAAVMVNVDFETKDPANYPTFSATPDAPWNTSPWNTTPWGSPTNIKRNWVGVSGMGYTGGLRMRIASNKSAIKWQTTDFLFESGGVL